MKKANIFLIIGYIMVVIAICFMVFALNHPEMSFPWSNNITYVIYGLYCIATVFIFFKSKRNK